MTTPKKTPKKYCSVEVLESRIAPAAAAAALPTIAQAEAAYDTNPLTDTHFVHATVGSPILLHAGQVLTTGTGAHDGTYLLFDQKGTMLVFTTDLNNNKVVDFNEITGISAGDGLRFTSFVDIHGDIVTNLTPNNTLSDSDNNPSNNDPFTKGDGLILLNSTIEGITMRSLTPADMTDPQNISARLAMTSYSIDGQILAGKGFGVAGDSSSGLIVDSSGSTLQLTTFTNTNLDFYIQSQPTIGAIRTGTAASGQFFNFNYTATGAINGNLHTFVPAAGQHGGDIEYIQPLSPTPTDTTTGGAGATTVTPSTFNLVGLYAGNGGLGARGGNIENVTLNGNTTGYQIIAGNGGSGSSGGDGGSINNFTDLNSNTAQVLIKTGDGGIGATGTGGDGGTLGLATIPAGTPAAKLPAGTSATPLNNLNIVAGLTIDLGNGGVGFKGGGNGASLSTAVINTPEGGVEFGISVVSTTHDGPHNPLTGLLTSFDPVTGKETSGNIGRSIPVDINEDGAGDVVFTTSNPDQLVVQFGDLAGGFAVDPVTGRPERIYLPGVVNGGAVVVGDFNGDGHQDVAVASSDPGNYAGLTVYLANWQKVNGTDQFLGFLPGRTSPLPTLSSGDPDGGTLLSESYVYLRTASAITDIAAGDFLGDGHTDIAVAASYVIKDTPRAIHSVIMVLTPQIGADGHPDGYFYADVGTKKQDQPPVGANPLVPFYDIGPSGKARIESSALSTVSTHDVIFADTVSNAIDYNGVESSTIQDGLYVLDFSHKSIYNGIGAAVIGIFSFDPVDTNRSLQNVALAPAFVRDFAINDFNGDGKADAFALTELPNNYIVGIEGDGLGGGVNIMENPSGLNNSGYKFGGNQDNLVAIRATNILNATTTGNGIALLNLGASGDGQGYVVTEAIPWNWDSISALTPGLTVTNPGIAAIGDLALSERRPSGSDATIVGFDTYYNRTDLLDFESYAVASPNKNPLLLHDITTPEFLGGFETAEAEHFVHISVGNGGDGVIGAGGAGGFIGGSIKKLNLVQPNGAGGTNAAIATLFGAVNVTLPQDPAFGGDVIFTAGNGGNGFTAGGSGGGVLGTSVQYAVGTTVFHSNVFLKAGSGGFGISGAGGKGGSLIANSIETGVLLTAGNGGSGVVGGDGGSIIGHGVAGFPDDREPFQQLIAGNGGNGIKAGGAGGTISNFHGQFDLFLQGDSAGILVYTAGNGGTAVSGKGGAGGDVLNTSPFTSAANPVNLMSGDVYLRAGDGGNGFTGGRGGNVDTFSNQSSQADSPAVVTFLAGKGGDGTQGNGGAGGGVHNISTSSKGSHNIFGEAPLIDGVPQITFGQNATISTQATVYDYDRIIAGAGGLSSGAIGGSGGTVTNIVSGNSDEPYVVVGGAGGDGLTRGGDGGKVSMVRLDLAGGDSNSSGKGLIIAGEGGSASGWAPNPLDHTADQGRRAFGFHPLGSKHGTTLVPGRGGNGGNIDNFSQFGDIGAHVDLIAGNGGSTIFYGTVADGKSFVGSGGSITHISVDGNIGNVVGTIAIKSYNDTAAGQTVGNFVDSVLRNKFVGGAVGDNVGNVGIVVGSAGRLKSAFAGFDLNNQPIYTTLPASKSDPSAALAGVLSGVTARNIMSAVAGSVDLIASIRSVTNVFVNATGVVGTDKAGGDPDGYLDRNGNPVSAPLSDGSLVDGALISASQPLRTDPVTGRLVPYTLQGHTFVIS